MATMMSDGYIGPRTKPVRENAMALAQNTGMMRMDIWRRRAQMLLRLRSVGPSKASPYELDGNG